MDSFLSSAFNSCRCLCKTAGFFQRPYILQQCEDKFTDELELTNLLTKIRDSYDMIKNLRTEEQKELLKYNEERVIDIEDLKDTEEEESQETEESSTKVKKASQKYIVGELNPQMNMSSMSVKKDEIRLPSEIKHAFNYSVVKGIQIDK